MDLVGFFLSLLWHRDKLAHLGGQSGASQPLCWVYLWYMVLRITQEMGTDHQTQRFGDGERWVEEAAKTGNSVSRKGKEGAAVKSSERQHE